MCNRYLIDPAVESILFLYSVLPAFDFLLLSSKLLFLTWKDILLQDSHTLNGNSILIYPIKCIWWLWFFCIFFLSVAHHGLTGSLRIERLLIGHQQCTILRLRVRGHLCLWCLIAIDWFDGCLCDLNNGHITVKSGKILQPSFSIWILW